MLSSHKILIVTTSYLPLIGGSELAIQNIARELSDIEFHVVTGRYEGDHLTYEVQGNVHIHRVGYGLAGMDVVLPKVLLPLAIAWKSWWLHLQHTFKIVHAYQASQAAGGALLWSILYSQLPFILTIQEGKDLLSQHTLIQRLRAYIIQHASHITAISSFLMRYVQSIHPKAPVTLIPNGVDVEAFGRSITEEKRMAMRTELGFQDSEKMILSIGRLVEKNGFKNLLRALSLVRLPARLVIIGDGPDRKALEDIVAELRIQKQVVFLGTLQPQHIISYLQTADVFVRPSLSEGFGNAFIEAMAACVAVVGSAVGGIPDFLHDRMTGLVCDPQSPKSIADSISDLLEDSELRDRIVKNAHALVCEKYDWRIVARQMYAVYSFYL